jgi:hypothetical protein
MTTMNLLICFLLGIVSGLAIAIIIALCILIKDGSDL